MISADGSYFTSLPGSYNTVSGQTWENFSFDISSYYGQTVKLAFVCLSSYGVYLMADDFAVTVNLETPEIESDFSLTPETGSAPLAVQFTDLSLGNPNNWYWSFGDGNTSTLQNPSHVFQDPGTYEVTLTVSNDTDSDTSPPKLVEVLTPVEIYLSESFESGLPDGWTIIDNNGETFEISNSDDDINFLKRLFGSNANPFKPVNSHSYPSPTDPTHIRAIPFIGSGSSASDEPASFNGRPLIQTFGSSVKLLVFNSGSSAVNIPQGGGIVFPADIELTSASDLPNKSRRILTEANILSPQGLE